jgi:hypothetical protein
MAAIVAMLVTSCVAVKRPIPPVTMTPLSKSEGPINVSKQAQVESQSSSENSTNGMIMFFGEKNTAFTATEVWKCSGLGEPYRETFLLAGPLLGTALECAVPLKGEGEIQYTFLDGKLRIQNNAAGSLPKNVPSKSAVARLGNFVTVSRPDKNTTYMIFPGLSAYCEMPRPNTVMSETNPPKEEWTDIGRETVDGHPCVKFKVVMTMPDGKMFENIVWRATDLNDFPIKIVDALHHMTATFKNINFSRPPDDLFEPPAGFKRYDNMQEMMMDSFKKK